MAEPRPLPGYAAAAREDVADAKRGRPDGSLQQYAQQRGLEWLDGQPAAGFLGFMPAEPGYNFNVCRGREDGVREWILFHEVYPWATGGDGKPFGTGTWYGLNYKQPGWWKWSPKELALEIPVIGDLIQVGTDEKPRAVGVPCTAVAIMVGEAAASGDWVLDNRPKDLVVPDSVHKLGNGWTFTEVEVSQPGFPEALMPVLAGWTDQPLFELALRGGVLRARCNGYAFDAEALDRLVATALHAAVAVREVALRSAAPQPFQDPLPPVDWPERGYSASLAHPPEPWLVALRALAADVPMTLEDPVAYVRAFPQQPVPGRPFAVLRGALPGVEPHGRLVFHAERSLRTHNVGRTAVILPAPPGTPDRPRERRDGVDYPVRGGLVATWQSRSSTTAGDVGDLRALTAAAAANYSA